ncbi:MAG: hypothetical protein KIT84_07655 [Labilithrix sp.]|nr:hypothetical protein [Labilithrix sp.]MCW5810871.1 hypothetical protein [Labilithrix sp.]
MAFLIAAAYFLRFWRETRDRLFVLFAIAFVGMALNRAMLVLVAFGRESQPYVYLVRLAAFVLIAFAVVDKNRR